MVLAWQQVINRRTKIPLQFSASKYFPCNAQRLLSRVSNFVEYIQEDWAQRNGQRTVRWPGECGIGYFGEVFSADFLSCRGVAETTLYSRSLLSISSTCSNILSLWIRN